MYNIVFHWLHVIFVFFTYEKGVLVFLGWCLSKTAFTIGWRMEVARLSFFMKEIQDKWGFNNTGLLLVFKNLRFNNTWKAWENL